MTQHPKFKSIEEWLNRFVTLWGFIPGSIITGLIGYFGFNDMFPPFLVVFAGSCALLLTMIAVGMASKSRERWIRIGLAALIIAAASGYGFRHAKVKRDQEAEAARKIADAWILQFDRPMLMPVILDGKKGPNGGQLMLSIQGGLVFDNPNPFDVWVKAIRRRVEIEGRTSRDLEREEIFTKVPRYAQHFGLNDLNIEFSPPLEIEAGLQGSLDFELCYGRDRNKLTKGFIHKSIISFRPDVFGNVGPPDYAPVDDDKGPSEYLDICRE